MSAIKNPKEEGPTLAGVIISAILLALVGVFLGFLFLASVPPKPFKSVADLNDYLEKNPETELLDIPYLQGSESRSSSWEQKREALLNGSAMTVQLTAGEMNAWMSAKFRQSSAAPAEDAETAIMILPGTPNFFVDASAGFFLNLPTELTIYGNTYDCMMITSGHFTTGSPVEFQVTGLRVNDATIPVVGGLGEKLIGILVQAYSQTDEFVAFQAAWEKVESVELVGDSIRLKLR